MFSRHHGCGRDRRFARDPFRFGGEPRGRAGGFRMRRVFAQGDLRYVALALIAEKPRHGYELIKAVEERLGGMYSPSPGVVYPTLSLLEELGYIAPEEAAGGKRPYAVTEAGRDFLAANRAEVEAVMGRMEEVARAFGGGPAPEIRRAMHNLRGALSVRLGKGPLTPEQQAAITGILDRAAGEIERS